MSTITQAWLEGVIVAILGGAIAAAVEWLSAPRLGPMAVTGVLLAAVAWWKGKSGSRP